MSEAQGKAPDQSSDASVWVDQHGDYLYRYALFRLRDSSAADDAVQETFLAALRAYEKFEGRGSERTWLVGILKHKITDHFRRITREAPIGQGEDEGPEHSEFFRETGEWTGHWDADHAPSDWHANPAELVEQIDFWKVFHDCLSPLLKRAASAFTLREVDGLTSEEICETLSIRVNNLWGDAPSRQVALAKLFRDELVHERYWMLVMALGLYDKAKHSVRYWLLRRLPTCKKTVEIISQSLERPLSLRER